MADETENYVVAYPEGATAWAHREPDGSTVTVSADKLRELLQLIGDCFPAVMGSMMKHSPLNGPYHGVYDEALTPKALADLCNRLSKVWCEGDLIVSRLFLGTDGKPIVNECAEKDD